METSGEIKIMVRLGVHVSIAGGFIEALKRGVEAGCNCMQIFLMNPRSWNVSTLKDEEIERFHQARRTIAKKINPIVAHMPYLPNLASQDAEIFQKSIYSLRENLYRCDQLGLEYLVMHMGKGEGQAALDRMMEGIARVYEKSLFKTCLLIENSAGQGKECGWQVPELMNFYHSIPKGISKGICIDTCHAFVAGYPIHTQSGLKSFLREIKNHIDISNLKIIHLNDSLKGCGSRVDRHAVIGQGAIGKDGFREILKHPAIKKLPWILEVPRNNINDDIKNLEIVKQLSGTASK